MKKWLLAALGFCLIFTACSQEMEGSEKINDIMQKEKYMRVILGESYHQREVRFDLENDKAVVPKNAEWGLPQYRDGAETGANYGEEGVDIYQSDKELNPELYEEFYLDSIRSLNLTVQDVKDSEYTVRVAKKSKLDCFEEELSILSGMVVKDSYELAGVEIQFDKKCRPIKKVFQFVKKDSTNLKNGEEDSRECMQEFSYNIGEIRFDWAFKRVKKMIEKQY